MSLFFTFLLVALVSFGQGRSIAITIDDLPRGGDGPRDLASVRALTERRLDALKDLPVTGFVNAGRTQDFGDAELQEILGFWKKQGAELGNHTFSHPDLNRVTLAEFEADLLRGEAAVRKARGGKQSRYFRHPFLHAGKDAATKRALDDFLVKHHYTVAPVTLDTSDWMFAYVYLRAQDKAALVQAYLRYMDSICAFFEKRAVEVTGREIAQILLIHANQLNADAMPDLLRLFAKRGYRIVGLAEALRDPAYKLADGYLGEDGISWIHRWASAKGMQESREPGEPKWLLEEFTRMSGR